MNWTKSSGIYWLKDFPFFDTCIRTGYQWYSVENNSFATLKEAKTYIINNLRKLKQVNDYEQIREIIQINESGWPNNIGEGVYIQPYINGVRYKWIVGTFQPWRSPCNYYSIRFSMDTSREYLETWAIKVFNRHVARFHNEINKSKI